MSSCCVQVALQRNVDVSRLTLREIGKGLYGRPVMQNGGPTHFEMLPVLPKTDTKSYEDWHRTAGHLDAHCEPDVHVKLAWTDGQPRDYYRCILQLDVPALKCYSLHCIYGATFMVLVNRKEWEGQVS